MFSRGFLLTFTFHCYREGAISNVLHQLGSQSLSSLASQHIKPTKQWKNLCLKLCRFHQTDTLTRISIFQIRIISGNKVLDLWGKYPARSCRSVFMFATPSESCGKGKINSSLGGVKNSTNSRRGFQHVKRYGMAALVDFCWNDEGIIETHGAMGIHFNCGYIFRHQVRLRKHDKWWWPVFSRQPENKNGS